MYNHHRRNRGECINQAFFSWNSYFEIFLLFLNVFLNRVRQQIVATRQALQVYTSFFSSFDFLPDFSKELSYLKSFAVDSGCI